MERTTAPMLGGFWRRLRLGLGERIYRFGC